MINAIIGRMSIKYVYLFILIIYTHVCCEHISIILYILIYYTYR